MRIVVCLKIVQQEPNPFDAAALEVALSQANAEIIVLCMGPVGVKEPLLRLTRLGKMRMILISDPVYAGSDTLATATILAAAIRKLTPDLIFCGRQSIDGDTAQVGPALATLLGFSLHSNVMAFLPDEIHPPVECRTRLGQESIVLPALLTLERIRTLRFPSIRSKQGTVEVWDNSLLKVDPLLCGLAGSPTRVLKVFESDRGRRKCCFIEKEELPALLANLAQKPSKQEGLHCPTDPQQELSSPAGPQLPCIWTVGEEVVSIAKTIAREVVVLPKESPECIADRVKRDHPAVLLWNADLWGRRTAPQVAAMLRTGLCADCTRLETDGKRLFMYRPAQAGNIIAKIECRTDPQMATVRTASPNSDIIIGCGRGVTGNLDSIKNLAKILHAELGASRGLVDTGTVPYENQIGLTGRTIAPRIYLAIGISGAVHHTCAIEAAETVIAVNPDKNARIFDYADFGILASYDDSFFSGNVQKENNAGTIGQTVKDKGC